MLPRPLLSYHESGPPNRHLTGQVVHKPGKQIHTLGKYAPAVARALGPTDGSRRMINALHHAAHAVRSRSLTAVRTLLDRAGVGEEPRFVTALDTVLEVRPLPSDITGAKLSGYARAAGDDFQALYQAVSPCLQQRR